LRVESDDFSLAFHFTLIIRKRPRDHDILPDKKLRFALDVSSAGAQVNDFPFEKSAVGGKMRIFGALRSRMPAHLFVFRTTVTTFPLEASRPRGPVGGRLECFFGHINSPWLDWFLEKAPGKIYQPPVACSMVGSVGFTE
jgi:hypothetical protein